MSRLVEASVTPLLWPRDNAVMLLPSHLQTHKIQDNFKKIVMPRPAYYLQ